MASSAGTFGPASGLELYEEPDLTMISRRGSGEKLMTAETALEIARRVHARTYGAVDLSANEPLKIAQSGNNWIVRGSKRVPPLEAGQTLDGPLAMTISQFDGQILSYRFELRFK